MDRYKNIKQYIKITRDYVQIKTIFTPKYIDNFIKQLNSASSTLLRIVMGF